MKKGNDQNMWYIIFTIFFAVIFLGAMWVLWIQNKLLLTSISLFDVTLIILATFRLIRLFVYDKIMQFFRDIFLDKIEHTTEGEQVIMVRNKPLNGPRLTVTELLNCPWCFGLWAGFMVVFFYFLTPLAWFVILVLAVSGVSSFIQILINMIGWKAEYLKKKVEGK